MNIGGNEIQGVGHSDVSIRQVSCYSTGGQEVEIAVSWSPPMPGSDAGVGINCRDIVLILILSAREGL